MEILFIVFIIGVGMLFPLLFGGGNSGGSPRSDGRCAHGNEYKTCHWCKNGGGADGS